MRKFVITLLLCLVFFQAISQQEKKINGQTLFGLKPSFGFYFPDNQKWTGKFSYINVFNRDVTAGKDFGSISFSIGFRLL